MPKRMIAHLSGAMGVEFGAYDLDPPLSDIQTEGVRSILDWMQTSIVGREATVRDFGMLNSRSSRVTGTPEHIAQQLADWQEAGIDGINVINATIPGSYTEFIEQVMPELRKRGLAKEATRLVLCAGKCSVAIPCRLPTLRRRTATLFVDII